jgi:hypothetical protein
MNRVGHRVAIIFEETMREAARRADGAVNRAMGKYDRRLVTDEDDLTGVLIGQLDAALEGQIGDLTWSTSIVRHRRGGAAEEIAIGADLIIHVSFKTPQRKYAKGVLVQAKRVEPATPMGAQEHKELIQQCNKMLNVTPAAFVFDYARGSMRCASASRIAGTTNRILYEECSWTCYRFFLELFRCPIGDPRLTSARVRELPVPTVLEITATSGE